MPQYAAGRIVEPPVWLPIAIGTMPAATAAAEPEDEPPGVCARSSGLRVGEPSRDANSAVTVLPTTSPPARRDEHDHRGVGIGAVAGVNRAAVGGRKVGGIEDVLDADRQSGERTLRKSGRLGRALCALDAECCERADVGLARCDRLRAKVDHLPRREFAGRDPAGQVEGGQHQA